MKYPLNRWALRRPGIIPVFFLSLFAGCQAQLYNSDARSVALGGCYSTFASGMGNLYNEAGLGLQSSPEFQLSHSRPFVIKELGISTLSCRFPLFPGTMNIGIQHVGIPGYQQVNSAVGYGMRISENISAGIGFGYYNTSTSGETSYLRSVGLSGGILVEAGESTRVAAHIINPVSINNYPGYGSPFPAILTAGIERDIDEGLTILGEACFNSERGLTLRTAAEYLILRDLFLRVGYHSNPVTLSFGSGIKFSRIMVNMAFAYSTGRGVTPALSLSYIPGK